MAEQRPVGNQILLAAITAIVATLTAEVILRWLAAKHSAEPEPEKPNADASRDGNTGTNEQ